MRVGYRKVVVAELMVPFWGRQVLGGCIIMETQNGAIVGLLGLGLTLVLPPCLGSIQSRWELLCEFCGCLVRGRGSREAGFAMVHALGGCGTFNLKSMSVYC